MTGILIHPATGGGVLGQPDIPMRKPIPNLPYICLTSLPDSPDDKGYHDFEWPQYTTQETEVRPFLEASHSLTRNRLPW